MTSHGPMMRTEAEGSSTLDAVSTLYPVRLTRARYYLAGAFVVEHGPEAGPPRDTAILLLPPMGYEDTCAYRPLRVLADRLAAAGFTVLRLDWPALGDSALDSTHPGLVETWIAAVEEATRSLRARGFAHVAGIGVRAGGLIALASTGFDDLALWGCPLNGKAYLREERAFHKLAAKAYGDLPHPMPPHPEGTIEAGGFLYSAATGEALQALVAPALASARGLQRALLIDRDGSSSPAALVDAFRNAGTEVTLSSAQGLGVLLENSYQSELRPEIEAAFLDWFGERAGRSEHGPHGGSDHLNLDTGITERPVILEGGAGELSGILCEPKGGARAGATWTLLLNAGGIRRSGPNRLWTRAARELAAAGQPSLRIDVRDVGDSDGTSTPHHDLEEMYSEASVEDVVRAYDWALDQGAGEIDVVGLCSGSFLGVQLAARRPVRHALLFNGLAFVWNDDARASGMTSHIRVSLLDARRWQRLLTGRISAVALAKAVAAKTWMTLGDAARRLWRKPPQDEVEQLLILVRQRGTELHLVSSQGDPSIAYLERHVAPAHRPPLTVLPGVDHTIRPVWAHEGVMDLIKASVGP